jgi:hypothetical protein
MVPHVEIMPMPKEYGAPTRTLEWPEVEQRIESAARYWIASVRRDGRPHTVPVDGLWLDGRWFWGGKPETVHMRNVAADPRVVMHLEDAESAVICEGTAELAQPSADLVDRLVAASETKYGYSPGRAAYAGGVWALRPSVVLAWNDLPTDATRFTF